MSDRELDALVAEKVMGWVRVDIQKHSLTSSFGGYPFPRCDMVAFRERPDGALIYQDDFGAAANNDMLYRDAAHPEWGTCDILPHFCGSEPEDISAAWSVVERMAELGWTVTIDKHPIGCGVSVSKSLAMEHGDAMRVSCGLPEVTGVDVPRCICLAALRAVGVEVES